MLFSVLKKPSFECLRGLFYTVVVVFSLPYVSYCCYELADVIIFFSLLIPIVILLSDLLLSNYCGYRWELCDMFYKFLLRVG